MMQRFYLERKADVSGISGTGRVAEGVVFESGTVVMQWLVTYHSINIFESLPVMLAVHGHGGATVPVFIDTVEKTRPTSPERSGGDKEQKEEA